jgi:hypothetical protein
LKEAFLKEIMKYERLSCRAHRRFCRRCVSIIDYRCAYGRFVMSPRDVAISNQNYLFCN